MNSFAKVNKKYSRKGRKITEKKALLRKMLNACEQGKFKISEFIESNYNPNINSSPSSLSDMEQYVPEVFAAEQSRMCGSLNDEITLESSCANKKSTKNKAKSKKERRQSMHMEESQPIDNKAHARTSTPVHVNVSTDITKLSKKCKRKRKQNIQTEANLEKPDPSYENYSIITSSPTALNTPSESNKKSKKKKHRQSIQTDSKVLESLGASHTGDHTLATNITSKKAESTGANYGTTFSNISGAVSDITKLSKKCKRKRKQNIQTEANLEKPDPSYENYSIITSSPTALNTPSESNKKSKKKKHRQSIQTNSKVLESQGASHTGDHTLSTNITSEKAESTGANNGTTFANISGAVSDITKHLPNATPGSSHNLISITDPDISQNSKKSKKKSHKSKANPDFTDVKSSQSVIITESSNDIIVKPQTEKKLKKNRHKIVSKTKADHTDVNTSPSNDITENFINLSVVDKPKSGKKSKKNKRKFQLTTAVEPDIIYQNVTEVNESQDSNGTKTIRRENKEPPVSNYVVKVTKTNKKIKSSADYSVTETDNFQPSVYKSSIKNQKMDMDTSNYSASDESEDGSDIIIDKNATRFSGSEPVQSTILTSQSNEDDEPFVEVTLNPDEDSVEDISSLINFNVNDKGKNEELGADLKFMTNLKRPAEQRNLSVHVFDTLCILVLKYPMTMHLHGKAKAKVIAGAVKIFGNVLERDKMYDVFAPTHSHCLDFETVKNDEIENCNIMCKLTDIGCSMVEARNIIAELKQNDAVVCLQALNHRKYDFIQEVYNKHHLFVTSKTDDPMLNQAVRILQCSLYIWNPPKALKIDPEWEKQIHSGEHDMNKVVVCGGKNFGKSTYLRYHVNTLLNNCKSVLVLDLDPGQCEFTVAGNISATVVKKPLLGPNFTHLDKPDILFHLAMVNVMDSIPRYLNGVKQLVHYCLNHPKYKEMPWVINTMGMINEYGIKIMVFLMQCVKPTMVIQFAENNKIDEFNLVQSPAKVKEYFDSKCANDKLFQGVIYSELNYTSVIHFSHMATDKLLMQPSRLRLLNYIAYFAKLLELHPETGFLAITPYEVSLKDLYLLTTVPVFNLEISKILNGKIVAFCTYSDEKDFHECNRSILIGEQAVPCLGFGLVRAVDCKTGKLYVLTPMPLADLAKVNAIVYTDWVPELPINPPPGVFAPYRMPLTDDSQLLQPAQRRFNPIQLLRTAAMP